jgi:hypothetical protein
MVLARFETLDSDVERVEVLSSSTASLRPSSTCSADGAISSA